MTESAILAILQLIEGILPLVMGAQNSQTTAVIDSIINALANLLPQIITWSETLYTAVKNILATLDDSGALTSDQIASTQALGAQTDAGWNAVVNQIDPDNPANAGTAAGDPGAT